MMCLFMIPRHAHVSIIDLMTFVTWLPFKQIIVYKLFVIRTLILYNHIINILYYMIIINGGSCVIRFSVLQ